ncbi:MAG: hypothetical protein C6I01_02520 [Epsilonproteobacteria bacterium]|nr:hypothetical protein [Campylobacterota bacterium]
MCHCSPLVKFWKLLQFGYKFFHLFQKIYPFPAPIFFNYIPIIFPNFPECPFFSNLPVIYIQ